MHSCSTKLLVTHTEEVVRDCILNELHALVREKYTGKKLMVKLINIHYSMPFNWIYFKGIIRCFRYCSHVLYTGEKYNYTQSQKNQ